MLMQRIITALILLPVLLAAVWWLPTPALFAFFALVGLLIAWEWAALMKLEGASRFAYVVISAALLGTSWLIRNYWVWLGILSLMWWCYAASLVLGYPRNFARRPPGRAAMAVFGQLILLPTIISLAVLHSGGSQAVGNSGGHSGALRLLYVFFLIFAADTGAYFAGRRFGRRKLAPSVSPGKSVEGVIGGLLLCAVWASTGGVAIFFADYTAGSRILAFVFLSLMVAAVSIVGDLTESLFKRAAGVKDSGTLLPGHGGFLDRTDSLLAAAPAMALGLYVLKL